MSYSLFFIINIVFFFYFTNNFVNNCVSGSCICNISFISQKKKKIKYIILSILK